MRNKLLMALLLMANIMYAQPNNGNNIPQESQDKWYIGMFGAIGAGTSKNKAEFAYGSLNDESSKLSSIISGVKFGGMLVDNKDIYALDLSLSKNAIKDLEGDNLAVGINILKGVRFKNNFIPYYACGVDYIWNSYSDFSGFDFNVGIGMMFDIRDSVQLDLALKYYIQKLHNDSTPKITTTNSYGSLGFGINYLF